MGTALVDLWFTMEDLKNSSSWRFSPARKCCPLDVIEEGEIVYQCNAIGVVDPSSKIHESVLSFQISEEFLEATTRTNATNINKGNGSAVRISVPQEIVYNWDSHSLFQFNIPLKGNVTGEHLEGDLPKALMVAQPNGPLLGSVVLEFKKIQPQIPRANWVRDFMRNGNTLTNVQVIFKFKTGEDQKILPQLQNHPRTWNRNIFSLISMSQKLLLDDPHADFNIEAEGMLFPCHKCFLAVRSPVLARMLNSNMSEVIDKKLKIADMSAEGVKAFLLYIYSGDVETAVTNARIAFEIFSAGHKYEMPDLVAVSQQILLSTEPSSYDGKTAMEMLKFGKTVGGFELLKEKAVIVCQENVEKMMEELVAGNALKP